MEERLTAAQRERLAIANQMTHDALKNMSSNEACRIIESVLVSRPDLSPNDLERLGNRIGRLAWEMGRG